MLSPASPTHIYWFWNGRNESCTLRCTTLPTGLRGMSAQKCTVLGIFMPPNCWRTKASNSSSPTDYPSCNCTTAVTASAHLSSGTPITAQSCTAGCDPIGRWYLVREPRPVCLPTGRVLRSARSDSRSCRSTPPGPTGGQNVVR